MNQKSYPTNLRDLRHFRIRFFWIFTRQFLNKKLIKFRNYFYVFAIVDSISWSNQGRLSLVGIIRPSTPEQRWRGTPANLLRVKLKLYGYIRSKTTGDIFYSWKIKKKRNWQLILLIEIHLCHSMRYHIVWSVNTTNMAFFWST